MGMGERGWVWLTGDGMGMADRRWVWVWLTGDGYGYGKYVKLSVCGLEC